VPHPVTGLPVIGIVGGGQLARMTYQAAIPLGVGVAVLATDPTESAALVAADVSIGHHTDWAALSAFAARVDVLTFDHEHVPGELLERLVAAGHRVHPGPQALRYAQDKLAMRRRLTELGLPAPRWTALPADGALEALVAFGDEVGWPVVAKAVRGGYDGPWSRRCSATASASRCSRPRRSCPRTWRGRRPASPSPWPRSST
jgi:5-(carboxyamino)imidazole ribonucleotide synthase